MTLQGGKHRFRRLIILLCFLLVVVEGYDLIAYGTVLPVLLKTPSWGLTPASAGLIGSASLIGLLVGSLTAGALADRLGRRRTIILGTAWISVWMAGCALPGGVTLFGVARFLVGVGIGAIVAASGVLAVEYAPRGRGQSYSALTWIGAAVGGLLGALLGLVLIPRFGPRAMFWAGAVPLVTLLPAIIALLPESPAFLLARGRVDEARALLRRFRLDEPAPAAPGAVAERRGMPGLFTRSRRAATVALGVLSALVLLVIYGLSTWLPVLMQGKGHTASTALVFLLLLNAGGAFVPPVTGRIADVVAPRVVTCSVLVAAAACVVLLTGGLPTPALLGVTFVAGGGTLGAQVLVYGFAAAFYPPSCRAAGVAWVAAVGRLGAIAGPVVTGLVIAGGSSPRTSLLLFAGVALVAAVCAMAVRQRTPGPGAPAADAVLAGQDAA